MDIRSDRNMPLACSGFDSSLPHHIMAKIDSSLLKPRFSRFNYEIGEFELIPNTVTFDLGHVLEKKMPSQFDVRGSVVNKTVIAALNIFDISETIIRAAQGLAVRYPGAYLTAFSLPRELGRVVAANQNVKLMAYATMPADDIPDPLAWKPNFASRVLEAGCHGVVVDFIPEELATQFPDREIWSDSHFPITN